MKRFIALCAIWAAGFGAAGWAQAKRPMTFEDLMAMKRVSDPQISPSGKWVLFSVTEVSLEKNTKVNHLWVVPLGGNGSGSGVAGASGVPPMSQKRDMGHPEGLERQVTFGDGELNGRFAPDGKTISLTMKDQLFEMPWDDAAGKVGDAEQVTNVNGGAYGAIWSPDGKRLLFVVTVYPECSDKPGWAEEDDCDIAKQKAADENPVKAQVWTHLLYRHWNQFTGERRSHVAVVDSDTGRHLRDLTPKSAVGDAETPTFSLGGPLGYAWAPDSKEVVYVANLDPVPAASTNNDVFTLRLDEAGARAVKVSTSLGSDDGPQYSPDGKWLAFRSQARAGYESDRFRLMLFDRPKQSIKELPNKLDSWVDEFIWSPDSKQVYFVAADAGREPIFSVDVDGVGAGQVAGLVQSGEFGSLGITPNGKLLIASGMEVTTPSTIVAIQTKVPDDSMMILSHVNNALLSQLDLAPLQTYGFLGATGTKVEGFIVRPPNFDPAKKYPVKFLIHGGPQGAWGDAWSYRWNAELMAASGYVVVMVNPRGSTGYGQAFIDGVNGDWGGKAYIDLMRGLDAAEAQFPFIDKTRECALGASYGGYMADWILTHTNRFKCIVTHDGMFNPQSAYGDTEEMWFNEWEFRRPGDDKPGQPWRYASGPEANDPFRKWSPMLHVQDAKTPTLVIHSQKDYRLDVSEGFQLFTALQRLGVPSEMLYFPDEGHWVQKPRNSELWYKTVGDWCDRWTRTQTDADRTNKNGQK